MSKTQFSVTQFGKTFKDYKWNEKAKTFSTTASNLVIDFFDVDGVTFITGSDCIFKTGSDCTFITGFECTFITGFDCTFKTGFDCTFKTGKNCVAIRYDVKGIILIPENQTIKFNDFEIAGYTVVEPVKQKVTLELTEEQLQKIKSMLDI